MSEIEFKEENHPLGELAAHYEKKCQQLTRENEELKRRCEQLDQIAVKMTQDRDAAVEIAWKNLSDLHAMEQERDELKNKLAEEIKFKGGNVSGETAKLMADALEIVALFNVENEAHPGEGAAYHPKSIFASRIKEALAAYSKETK